MDESGIDRTIKDGFIRPTEDFQIDIDHRTKQFSMSVVFPVAPPPRKVLMIEKNSTRSKALGPEYRSDLADGRVECTWSTDKARLFEAYILRWEW